MQKSRDAFRTISEVSEWLDTPAHVLRFWESKFSQIKPVKRAGGRRYYRPDDMDLLGGIKRLLHEDGMTIKGVQKLLREKGVKHVASMGLSWHDTMGDAEVVDVVASDQTAPADAPLDSPDTVDAPLMPQDDADDPQLIEAQTTDAIAPPAPRPPRAKEQARDAAMGDLFATEPPATGVVVSLDAARAQKQIETQTPATTPTFQTARLLSALSGADIDRLRKRGKQISGLVDHLRSLQTRLRQD